MSIPQKSPFSLLSLCQKFLQSVDIWQSYVKKYVCTVFLRHGVYQLLILICTVVFRFLLSFEKCVEMEGKKTSSDTNKAGVRGKRRRQILNGASSRHGPVLKKKKKVAKSEPPSSQPLDSTGSVNSADTVTDGDGVADKQMYSEVGPDADKCRSSPPVTSEAPNTDESTQPESMVRCDLVLGLFSDGQKLT